jgi:hypothetical protein
MPRAVPIAFAVAVVLAWGGAAWLAISPRGSGTASAASDVDRTGAGEVRSDLRELRGKVLGKSTNVRGDKVIGNVVKPQEQDFNYTPREVCVKMKLDYPEQYANLDCSKREYDSPHSWNDWGD